MGVRRDLASILARGALLAATAGIAVVNGLPLTSLFDSANHVLYLFTRGSRLVNPDFLYYLTSLCISVMTLLLAGIPAALYERLRGIGRSSRISLAIWLVAAALISLPALRALARLW